MSWITPTLRRVRELVRDDVSSALSGAATIGNNVLRVMSDAMAGLAHLTLRYIDWLAKQLMPDTAQTEWLDRHGDIWLTNSDSTTGRKGATFASGTVGFTGGTVGDVVPPGTELSGGANIGFETLEETIFGTGTTECSIRALEAGAAGNLEVGTKLSFLSVEFEASAEVIDLSGGTDEETDDQLRLRVLFRIREPPAGGDAADYKAWALAVPGVTRAWASPLEMGIGTVTVRFMMDVLRASSDGFPLPADVDTVTAYLDSQRPVAVKDRFVEVPIAEPVSFEIRNLIPDDSDTRAAILANVEAMLFERAAPAYSVNGVAQEAQTIYAAWVSEAIIQTDEVVSFRLIMDDHAMPSRGHMGVLGAITYS